jgi:signal transduction histidine kinase
VLLVEDTDEDAALVERALAREGLTVALRRVETREAFVEALGAGVDVVVSDFSLPTFSATEALQLVQARGLEVPFILVSGTVGESVAVEMMRAGAHDYLLKGDLLRLGPVIQRELREVAHREAQRRQDRLLELAQSLAQVGSFEVDLATGSSYWTQEAERLIAPAAQGTGLARLYAHASAAREHVEAAIREPRRVGERFEVEYEVRDEAGQPRWLRAIGQVGVDQRLVGAVQDITGRRRLEAQLLLADRLSSMGMVAAGVAHEVNNPLAFISGNLPHVVELVQELAADPSFPPRVHQVAHELQPVLKDCIIGADRIRSIVSDLKVYMRHDDAQPGPVDLDRVLRSVVRMSGNEARFRANVYLELQSVGPVRGVESRVAQVFTNLLVNALQALPERPPSENRITLRSRAEGPDAIVEVEDNGRGIAPELLSRVFDPFFTTKPVGIGTGLGLSVCKQLVESVGGAITVKSADGAGATFRVRMPLWSDAPVASSPSPVPQPQPGMLRVLVIDDEPRLARAITRMLKGYSVVTKSSAVEALASLELDSRFDAVVCDLMMPGLSGMEFHQKLREQYPALAPRSLFMTGGIFTPEARTFVQVLSPERLLEKPFTTAQLVEAIARLLAPAAG